MDYKDSRKKSFYEDLSQLSDLRGGQGKRYYLPYILATFILGILVGRKEVSSIHRYMENRHKFLSRLFNYRNKKVISRSQLPRVLRIIDWSEVNELTLKHFGVEIQSIEDEWIAVDGKTLRGSLTINEKGHKSKQGEVQINAVRHGDGKLVAQTYYNGNKESEIIVTRDLLEDEALNSKSITLDALHTVPKTLEPIAQSSGRYLVQVKENQKELLSTLKKV